MFYLPVISSLLTAYTVPQCDLPSTVANGNIIVEDVMPYKSVVSVSCHDGHKFEDGTSIRSFICIDGDRWHTPIVGCKCKCCNIWITDLHKYIMWIASISAVLFCMDGC